MINNMVFWFITFSVYSLEWQNSCCPGLRLLFVDLVQHYMRTISRFVAGLFEPHSQPGLKHLGLIRWISSHSKLHGLFVILVLWVRFNRYNLQKFRRTRLNSDWCIESSWFVRCLRSSFWIGELASCLDKEPSRHWFISRYRGFRGERKRG